MKYSIWPGSKEQISRLGFGAMGLGGSFGSADDQTMILSVLHALDKGVNFIDTARAYGRSEELVGKALKQWNGEKPFLASKVKSQASGEAWGIPAPVEVCFPKGSVRESVEQSLRELDVDVIDLMQHQYWPGWEKADYWMDELLQLKQAGKIRYIGISVNDHRHDTALSLVQTGQLDSIQTILNIFDPIALDCLLPLCEQTNTAFIARCILNEGGLTGFLKEDTTFGDGDFRKTFFDYVPREMYMERVDRLRHLLPHEARNLAELAIKFLLHSPGVTTAITSMQVTSYADENIQAIDQPALTPEAFDLLRKKHRWVRNFFDTKYW